MLRERQPGNIGAMVAKKELDRFPERHFPRAWPPPGRWSVPDHSLPGLARAYVLPCFVFEVRGCNLVDDPAEGCLVSGTEAVKTSAEYSVRCDSKPTPAMPLPTLSEKFPSRRFGPTSRPTSSERSPSFRQCSSFEHEVQHFALTRPEK